MNITSLSKKAKAIYTLYKMSKINEEGVNKAFNDGIISQEELDFILEE